MTILVLGGGTSSEREVSLRSAKSVSEALRAANFKVLEADPKDGGDVFKSLPFDTIVFPILHGAGGEDGVIQKELESRDLPYLGSNSESSRICFDKSLTREVLAKNGLPIAEGDSVTATTYLTHPLARKPHVLKISNGGSSIGTYIVRDIGSIDKSKVDEVFTHGNKAVLEELVEGSEITVPILDNKALPVIEIRPPVDGEFDYENKYNGATEELCPPISINESLQKQAQLLAERTHEVLGSMHLSRVDIIVRPDESMVILETNTMPGLTDQSLYPKSALVAGMDMPQLVKVFVELTKRDYGMENGGSNE